MFSSKYVPIPFAQWLTENEVDLRAEFESKYPSSQELPPYSIECSVCDGSGSSECDLGYAHMCHNCKGTGDVPTDSRGRPVETFRTYAHDMYHDQIAVDRACARRFEKEMSYA